MSAIAASMFGLFVANMTNISIPLTGVHYDVSIKSFASQITIKQTYKNVEQTDLECVYGFPINDQAAIVGLTVTIGNRTLTSQFKKKEEAFKDYTEALARGDGAYLLDQSDRSDDTYVLSVGRLPPGKEAIISISYVNTLESITETKMRLTIPTALYPRYNPNPQAPKGVAPPENYQAAVSYKATLSGHINAIDEIQNVSSTTHPLKVTAINPNEVSIAFAGEQEPLDRDLLIDIDLKNNPQHYVEVQNTADGKYTAMYAFVPDFKQAGAVNTEIIFVVDCSGSMEDEDRIGDAKKAMQIFLRSLPEGTYFNFYRFGGTFESVFNESQLYSAESFEKAKVYGEQTDASLGGTEVLEPLQKIYSQPARSGFSRQIFLLTDGEVSNTDDVVSLVRNNAANTRLFSFGLGQSPSRSLVNGIAAAGNGKAEYIKKGQDLEGVIARQLTRALRPAITDASLTWNGVKNLQQVPTKLPAVFKGDRQLVFAIFDLDDAVTAPVPYIELQRGSNKLQIPVRTLSSPDTDPTEKPFLEKLAARELIRQVENSAPAPERYGYHGSLQSRAPVLTNDQIKEHISALSLAHGVLSKYVSLVAVEQRSEERRKNASDSMTLREIPVQKAEPRRPMVSYDLLSSGHASYGSRLNTLMGASGRSSSSSGLSSGGRGGSYGLTYQSAGQSSGSTVRSHAALEEIQEPATTSIPAFSSPLNELLALQAWNGVWKFSDDLTRLTHLTQEEVKHAINNATSVNHGVSDETLATILAVTVIQEIYPDQPDVWFNIVKKAEDHLARENSQADLDQIKDVLLQLIRTKKTVQ